MVQFDSHHPTAQKIAVVQTLFTRADNICSTIAEREKERLHIANVMQANGYILSKTSRITDGTGTSNSICLRELDLFQIIPNTEASAGSS